MHTKEMSLMLRDCFLHIDLVMLMFYSLINESLIALMKINSFLMGEK